MRLIGECVFQEEWMTDICISFWDVKSLDISIYLQTEQGTCPHHLSSLLDGFVIDYFHWGHIHAYLIKISTTLNMFHFIFGQGVIEQKDFCII